MIKSQQKRTINDDLQRLSQKETLDYLRFRNKSTDELEVYKSQIESDQHGPPAATVRKTTVGSKGLSYISFWRQELARI